MQIINTNSVNNELNLEENKRKITNKFQIIGILTVIIILTIVAWFNFMLFHTIIEFWAMLVAACIFIIAWNTRQVAEDKTLLFLGIGYLCILILTFFHTITYEGINIIEVSANEPTQFWMAARFLEMIFLALLPYYPHIRFKERQFKLLILIMVIFTAGIISSILVYPFFPDAFIPGQGLTTFKVYGEYLIILVLIFTIYNLKMKEKLFDVNFVNYMIGALIMSILAELAFTLYSDVYGISNIAGHVFYLISFIMVYNAIVCKGLKEPTELIFNKLKKQTKNLAQSNSFLNKVLESLTHPFYVINADNYKVEIANSAAKSFTEDSSNNQTCYEMTHNSDHPCNAENHICPLEKVKKSKKPVITEHIHQDQNGSQHFFEIHGFPVLDESGEVKQLIEYSLDISKRKKLENKINDYTMELELKSLELENAKQRLDNEIEKAKRLHEKTLPQNFIVIDNLSFTSYYQSAQELGGDFHDLIKKDNKIIFYLSDVTGHGLDAAMLSSFIKTTINNYISFSSENNIVPTKILKFLTKQYRKEDYPEDYFICIFMVVLDLKTEKLEYSGMGFQDTPLLANDNYQKQLISKGLPISGVTPPDLLDFSSRTVNLKPEDTIIFNTDGLTEQYNGDKYYNKRYKEIFFENSHLPPQKIKENIVDDFYQFNNNSHKGQDDITFLIMKFKSG